MCTAGMEHGVTILRHILRIGATINQTPEDQHDALTTNTPGTYYLPLVGKIEDIQQT